MRVGLISDIHANLVALEAVLEDMPDVEEVICAGDVVGYNPWPGECVDRVREVCSVCVQGNHDRLVETPERYAHNEMAGAGLEHAKSQLDTDQRDWLDRLPARTTFAEDRYLLAHSHPDPARTDEYVFPRGFSRMRPYLDDYDGLVLGHIHRQHSAVIDGKVVVNPGSVGQPRDRDPDAAYAVLDTETNTVDLRRVSYDIDRVIARVEELGLPVTVGTRLLDGT